MNRCSKKPKWVANFLRFYSPMAKAHLNARTAARKAEKGHHWAVKPRKFMEGITASAYLLHL